MDEETLEIRRRQLGPEDLRHVLFHGNRGSGKSAAIL